MADIVAFFSVAPAAYLPTTGKDCPICKRRQLDVPKNGDQQESGHLQQGEGRTGD
jgi:hypothetical protein